MRLLFLGVILFAMFSFALGQAKNQSSTQNSVEQELKGLENEWLNSYLRGDKQTFDRIVADDFTRTDESGKFATKAEKSDRSSSTCFCESISHQRRYAGARLWKLGCCDRAHCLQS